MLPGNKNTQEMKQTMKIKLMTLLTATLILTASISLFAEGTDGVKTTLRDDDARYVRVGEKVYAAHCASCHGAELEGQANWRKRDAEGYLPAPPHDETGHTWHHADDLLFEITKDGPGAVIGEPDYQTRMPAYAGVLSDDQIIAVLSYIKFSWPEEQRGWQEEINNPRKDGFTAPGKPAVKGGTP